MEVAQIARAMATALKLNEDMTEALALVHDIGHPPFGHAGERALDEALQEFGLRFDHNLHALRMVEYFEVRYAAFRGLNLTLGVREGIVKHSRSYSPVEHPELRAYFLDQQPPLEAQLIDLADEIAYLTADMDDGMEAGMLHPRVLRQHVRIFDESLRAAEREYPTAAENLLSNEALKKMLNTLVGDLIGETARRVEHWRGWLLSKMSGAHRSGWWPFPRISRSSATRPSNICTPLFTAARSCSETCRRRPWWYEIYFACWVNDPSLLPAANQSQIAGQGVARVVADYIAAMTDNYILLQYGEWLKGRPSVSD